MDERDMLLFWMQMSSVLIALAAAILWFWSAVGKAPPATFDGGAQMQNFLNGASRLNRWAASFTALLVLSQAATTVITLRAQPAGERVRTEQTAARTSTSGRLIFDCAEDYTQPVDADGATIDKLTIDLATKKVGWKGHTTNDPLVIRQAQYSDNTVDNQLGPPCTNFVRTTDVQVEFGLACDVVEGKTVINYNFPYWALNRYNQELHYFVGHHLRETERCARPDEREF